MFSYQLTRDLDQSATQLDNSILMIHVVAEAPDRVGRVGWRETSLSLTTRKGAQHLDPGSGEQ